MDIREITAEKIRAMNDRIRYRDFYDFAMISIKLGVNLKEVFGLMMQKEVRKNISPKNILSNWMLAKADKNNELLSIHYSEELAENNIEAELKKLQFEEVKKNI